MIPKKPAPDLIRGGYRFSEEIMLQQISWSGMTIRRKVIPLYRPAIAGTGRGLAARSSLSSPASRNASSIDCSALSRGSQNV